MLPELIKPLVFIFWTARGPLVKRVKSSVFFAGATSGGVEGWMEMATADEGEGDEKRDAHVFGFVAGRERTRWKWEGGFARGETSTGGALAGSLGRVEQTTKESDMLIHPVTHITCYAAKQHQMAPALSP